MAQVARQHAQHRRGAEQEGRWVEQAGRPEEPLGEDDVVLGCRLVAVDVGVDHPDRQWPRSLNLGQGKVGASCQLPGGADGFGGGPEKASRQVMVSAGEAVPQRHRLQRGDRHALGVDGVETADRIAEDQ